MHFLLLLVLFYPMIETSSAESFSKARDDFNQFREEFNNEKFQTIISFHNQILEVIDASSEYFNILNDMSRGLYLNFLTSQLLVIR
jgi:hypothetical protein